MYHIALSAVRRRSGPAFLFATLSALLATAASCAVWYGLATASQAAGNEVISAPVEQRMITVHQGVSVSGDPRGALDDFAARVDELLPVSDTAPVLGVVAPMTYVYPGRPGASTALSAAYRDGFCEHARLTGSCPARPREAAVSADIARRLGLAPGDTFEARGMSSINPVRFQVSAVYEPVNPNGAFWSDPLFRAQGSFDPFFTSLDSFRDPSLSRSVYAWGPQRSGAVAAGRRWL